MTSEDDGLYRDVCIVVLFPILCSKRAKSLALQNKEAWLQLNGSVFGNEKPGFSLFFFFLVLWFQDVMRTRGVFTLNMDMGGEYEHGKGILSFFENTKTILNDIHLSCRRRIEFEWLSGWHERYDCFWMLPLGSLSVSGVVLRCVVLCVGALLDRSAFGERNGRRNSARRERTDTRRCGEVIKIGGQCESTLDAIWWWGECWKVFIWWSRKKWKNRN